MAFRNSLSTANATRILLCAALVSWIAGCGDGGPTRFDVRGRVTYRGKPVANGWISFTRIDAVAAGQPMRPATGELDQDGRYVMKTFGRDDGVMPGRYAVAIVAIDYERARAMHGPGQAQPFVIPEKYTRPDASGLTVTVPEEPTTSLKFDFDLKD